MLHVMGNLVYLLYQKKTDTEVTSFYEVEECDTCKSFVHFPEKA